MKIALSTFLLVIVAIACSKKETSSVEWPGMDSFHMIMAESYHPLKDSSNIAPAKKNAEEMAAEAEIWAGGALPEKVDNDEVKAMLAELKTDTRTFADQVKANASDSVLSLSMESLHNKFHKIMEAWHGGGEHKEH